jgi:hypothetical protein
MHFFSLMTMMNENTGQPASQPKQATNLPTSGCMTMTTTMRRRVFRGFVHRKNGRKMMLLGGKKEGNVAFLFFFLSVIDSVIITISTFTTTYHLLSTQNSHVYNKQ